MCCAVVFAVMIGVRLASIVAVIGIVIVIVLGIGLVLALLFLCL